MPQAIKVLISFYLFMFIFKGIHDAKYIISENGIKIYTRITELKEFKIYKYEYIELNNKQQIIAVNSFLEFIEKSKLNNVYSLIRYEYVQLFNEPRPLGPRRCYGC